jgi:hypothetical protein
MFPKPIARTLVLAVHTTARSRTYFYFVLAVLQNLNLTIIGVKSTNCLTFWFLGQEVDS